MSIYRCEDPAMDWELYEADREAALADCPKCAECGNPITDDHMYDIDGVFYCEDCIDSFRVWTWQRMER